MYILNLNNISILKTRSYRQLYRYIAKILAGGMAFGIDMRTLNILGYTIEVK